MQITLSGGISVQLLVIVQSLNQLTRDDLYLFLDGNLLGFVVKSFINILVNQLNLARFGVGWKKV